MSGGREEGRKGSEGERGGGGGSHGLGSWKAPTPGWKLVASSLHGNPEEEDRLEEPAVVAALRQFLHFTLTGPSER